MKKEFVYILTNAEYEGLVKIGKTTIHPEVRAYQMNRQTSTIGKFFVEWYMEVPNCNEAEDILKKEFKSYWFQKEFYAIELATIIFKSQNIIAQYFKIDNPIIYLKKDAIELKLRLEISKIQIELEKKTEKRKPKELE